MFFAIVKLSERLNWFDNPNTTGALIAIFAVAVWVLPVLLPGRQVVLKELLWWVAIVACVCLGKLLLETGSRGGVAAAGSGLVLLMLLSGRPWRWWRLAGVAVALVVIGVLAFYVVHPAERLSLAHSIGDASIGNRLRIWKWVPAMVADAPGGWGWHNAPEAFMMWYQDLDHRERYAALVNTHLEWLVEFGWAGRLGYLFGWALALRLAWPWCGRSGARVSLKLYWELGQDIVAKQLESSWGSGFFEQLSKDLRSEFPHLQGFSSTNLKYCKRFYLFYSQDQAIFQQVAGKLQPAIRHQLGDELQVSKNQQNIIRQQVADELGNNPIFKIPWRHHVEIFTECKTVKEALFYVQKTIENGWSRAVLMNFMEADLYSVQGKR